MYINWKSRLTNKAWWIAVISVLLLIGQHFGFDFTTYIGEDWQTLIALIFALLALTGVTVDTSTPGISDKEIQQANDLIHAINTINKVKTQSTAVSINNEVNKDSIEE